MCDYRQNKVLCIQGKGGKERTTPLHLEAVERLAAWIDAADIAGERGSGIIDLQDFAGHADPRTTLSYIRSRDRLSNSPAYVLKY